MRRQLAERIERVREIVVKEFRQILRDPRLNRVIFFTPVIQLLLFGYAVSTDVFDTPMYVVDHDRSQASRGLIDEFTASGYFRVADASDRPAELVQALNAGSAVVGLEVPRGFGEQLHASGGAHVQLLLDGTNSNTASVAGAYAERIVLAYGADVEPRTIPPPLELHERAWFNPDLSSRDYNVPAVIGAILMLVALLLTSLAIVREREIGTLEQLRVSPLSAGELIAGKLIPFGIIGLLDMMLVTVVAVLWFRIPLAGNPLLLLAASVLYLLATLGIGLLISTLAATQQEAFMVSFLVYMPAILLSGFMFPISSMPAGFQWLTLLNPMRHYLEVVRGVFLKGVGLGALWPQYTALLVMGIAVIWFSAARFRAREG